MNLWSDLELAPRDPILGLTEAFVADPRPDKVNLGVGVYLDETGKIPLLSCVHQAELKLADAAAPRGYLPIDGLPAYVQAVRELVYGADHPAVQAGRVVVTQSLGGTGALKIGAEFLKLSLANPKVLISDPSWENHAALFAKAGYQVGSYRYYQPGGVDLAGMLADLSAAEPGTVVVLHACCHNPTGYDLSNQDWQAVAAAVAERGLIPFLDLAYQGFADGVAPDGAVVRQFAELGIPMLVASSFSKSFGLYGERTGALSVVAADSAEAARVLSQLKVTIRTTYSNPPTHGPALVAGVLTDPVLRQLWLDELEEMRLRIRLLRQQLVAALAKAGASRDFSFIADQVGMFSYCGLSVEQMRRLRSEHGIYGTDAGRICVAGLNQQNLTKVATAISAVL